MRISTESFRAGLRRSHLDRRPVAGQPISFLESLRSNEFTVTFQIRVRLLWAEKPKRGIRCCSMASRRLVGWQKWAKSPYAPMARSLPATPRESSACYCWVPDDTLWAEKVRQHGKRYRPGSPASTSRAFSTSGLVHWMGCFWRKSSTRIIWCRYALQKAEGISRKTRKSHKQAPLPVDQASSTVFPAKPLFTRASGFSGQRVASRCGYIPLRPGPKFQELLKNGGYKYVSKGLPGRLQDWKRERGVCNEQDDEGCVQFHLR